MKFRRVNGSVLRVSGPVAADDAQTLLAEVEANDPPRTVQLHGYVFADTEALVVLFGSVSRSLERQDRWLNISTANSPELDVVDLIVRLGPRFRIVRASYGDGTR